MSWTDGPLLAFDLETTGPDPETARIVTATLILDHLGYQRVRTWLANPGVEIPAEATAVHGISTEEARESGEPIADVLFAIVNELADYWGQAHPVPLVAYNGAYDLTVLDREVSRHDGVGAGLVEYVGGIGPVIDPLVLDRSVDRYRKGKRTLSAACALYGVELVHAHSSDADALAAAQLARKIGRRYPEVGRLSLDELVRWQQHAHREWADHFGAYLRRQGKPDDVSRHWPLRPATPDQAVSA